jgi:hypothetical protein
MVNLPTMCVFRGDPLRNGQQLLTFPSPYFISGVATKLLTMYGEVCVTGKEVAYGPRAKKS